MAQIRKYLLIFICLAPAGPLAAQRFFPDDPLWREPPPLNVKNARARQINDYFDFFQSTFFPPDKKEIEHHQPGPSEAVNTLGEVPDSAWFTNRMGARPMSTEELVRGPGVDHAPATDKSWIVVSAKNEGVTPGLVVRDSANRKYFLKFDPIGNRDMATAADVVGAKFYYALGYNAPENYIVYFRREQYDESAKELQIALPGEANPDQTDLFILGADFENLSRYKDAADAFNRCAQIAGSMQDRCKQLASDATKRAAEAK